MDGASTQFEQGCGGSQSLSVRHRAWSLVYTRPQQEKALARRLYRSDIPFYLPLHLDPRPRCREYKPLFARQLFLYGAEGERFAALKTGLVSRIVPVREQDQLRRDLLNLQILLRAERVPLTREPDMIYGAGGTYQVESGLLEGLVGTVVESSPPRLFVGVECLQMGVSIPGRVVGLMRRQSRNLCQQQAGTDQ